MYVSVYLFLYNSDNNKQPVGSFTDTYTRFYFLHKHLQQNHNDDDESDNNNKSNSDFER